MLIYVKEGRGAIEEIAELFLPPPPYSRPHTNKQKNTREKAAPIFGHFLFFKGNRLCYSGETGRGSSSIFWAAAALLGVVCFYCAVPNIPPLRKLKENFASSVSSFLSSLATLDECGQFSLPISIPPFSRRTPVSPSSLGGFFD